MTGPCRRSGCPGEVEDGYCNVCGHAAASKGTPAPGAGPGPMTGAPAPAGGCVRPGCSGDLEDGYCNVCGLAGSTAASGPGRGSGPSSSGPSASGSADRGSTMTQETGRFGRTDAEGSTGTGTTSGSPSGPVGSLGAGLVDMPAVSVRDPQDAVLVDPGVPERKRFCGTCGEPVGREREGRPGRTEGFCAHCGAPFSFDPKLHPGDKVAGQYDVAGCLAHGGLGWVYLARDRNVNDRWVVLKGLLDAQDRSAMAAAIAERRFLAEVRHPNIVSIYNFVQHEDAGYIVMEYVGGESLREVRNGHRERFGAPLPVAQAIAYILQILPAFAYLHRRGLLFCDFKPDNVIQSEDHLKLIDLGGVRSIDDDDSDLYGTIGYQAPEVSDRGASVSSDLYTVARTLAVLSFDFAGFQDERRYATSLPPAHEVPQFGRYESLHLFLLKATAEDPRARFQSAAEMADQLTGVLREVVAVDGGSPAPAPSTLFSGELCVEPESCTWQNLPLPVVDPLDAAAPLLATAVLAGPDQARAVLQPAPDTPELVFHLARLAIDEGDLDEATRLLNGVEARRGGWRAAWWRGILALARGAGEDAQPLFAAVGTELPGERAPKLALAVAHELAARRGRRPRGGRQASGRSRPLLRAGGRHRQFVRQCHVRAGPGPHRPGGPLRRRRRPVPRPEFVERLHLGAARTVPCPLCGRRRRAPRGQRPRRRLGGHRPAPGGALGPAPIDAAAAAAGAPAPDRGTGVTGRGLPAGWRDPRRVVDARGPRTDPPEPGQGGSDRAGAL